MATLYVENVPDDLYAALKARAKSHRSSMAAEVVGILSVAVPTKAELRRRKKLFDELAKIRAKAGRKLKQPLPDVVDLIREDRER